MQTSDNYIFIRCYAELNDFLPPEQQFKTFALPLVYHTIQEVIEYLHIPPSAVDLVLINGEAASFDSYIEPENRIALYPVFEAFDISSIQKLREHPLRKVRFVADVHLGKLAKHLRLFGFDTVYSNTLTLNDILTIASTEQRIILSMNSKFHTISSVTHFYHIRTYNPFEQLINVLTRFDLWNLRLPFTRCLNCNTLFCICDRSDVAEHFIPLRVREWCSTFYYCSHCNKYYWKGSHYTRLVSFVERVLQTGISNDLPITYG